MALPWRWRRGRGGGGLVSGLEDEGSGWVGTLGDGYIDINRSATVIAKKFQRRGTSPFPFPVGDPNSRTPSLHSKIYRSQKSIGPCHTILCLTPLFRSIPGPAIPTPTTVPPDDLDPWRCCSAHHCHGGLRHPSLRQLSEPSNPILQESCPLTADPHETCHGRHILPRKCFFFFCQVTEIQVRFWINERLQRAQAFTHTPRILAVVVTCLRMSPYNFSKYT